MRFDRKSKEARKRWSDNAHAAKRRKRLAGPVPDRIDRPKPGRFIARLQVELPDRGFEIVVTQADRMNQIVAATFGTKSKPHGMDWLMCNLRKKLVTRWIHE